MNYPCLRSLGTGAIAAAVLAAAGCRTSDAPSPEPATTAVPAPASGRVVEITAAANEFSPSVVEAKAGETLALRFTRTTPSGCMSSVALPGLGIRRELPLRQAVDVTVTAPTGGALPFECGMGMVQGRVVVSDGTGAVVATPGSPAASADARPHADHDPRHGGVVTMEGDLHVEVVVAPDGAVDLYVSDSIRRPIPPAEVTGTLTIDRGKAGKQVVSLVADPGRGAVSTRAAPPEQSADYTWDLQARGQKTSMTLAVPAGGTAKLTGSTDTPGGGNGLPEVRRAFGGGQVALTLDAAGDARLRLLDAAGKRMSTRDVKATIRIGAKETPFSYDAARDELHAEVGPVKGDHADALITFTIPGGKPTSVRSSFHLEQTAKKH